MRAVTRAAAGRGMTRRVQKAVIFLVLLATTASATTALALLVVDTGGPFQQAFAAQHGADAVVGINVSRATEQQLAATSRLPEVTSAAGPFQVASMSFDQGGYPGGTVTVAGRAAPGGPVDDVTLTAGRWATRPGEIVIATDLGQGSGTQVSLPIGSKVTVTTAPGHPQLTVVGQALSVTDSAGAWVVPAELPALQAATAHQSDEMLYQFRAAGSAQQVRADVAKVTAALPAGAVAGYAPWQTAASEANGNSSIIAPFVIAFAIMGLALSVLIVTNVVGGVVVSGRRRIGVLKSIGLTPRQVTTAYLTWVGRPAVAGCLLGVVLGNLLAMPVLSHSASVYGVAHQFVPPWVDVVTPLAMCALVGIAALVPAVRASRLSAVQAIATGQAPSQGRGYTAHRLLARLPLPRPVTIGLAAPFARPGRTAVMLAAILFGTTAVLFAVGLDAGLGKAAAGVQTTKGPGQVTVQTGGNNPVFTGSQQRQAIAAISAQLGTAHYVAQASPTVGVSGLTREVNADAFDGNATWLGFDMVTGHWYSGPGQVDVNTVFLTQTGLSVGDTTSLTDGGTNSTVKIVGEVYFPSNQPLLLTSWQTLGGAAAGLTVGQYDIVLKPGVSSQAYGNGLGNALGPNLGMGIYGSGQFFTIATSLIGTLTLMIAVVAGLGVLNTVLLGTRERTHDLGVFKALGMTPREVTAMVVCWVAAPALAAAVIAIPAARTLGGSTLQAMANAAGTAIPASWTHALSPVDLGLLALSGLVIAAAGALLPGTWAARSRTATALRAE
ncbi:MAG TPA: ABC transporter permease [Streptosporangiaceae bacterium]|nr:ABC transporter permease [Streptosporangiaceae bacterium]